MKLCNILMTTPSLTVDWQAILYSLSFSLMATIDPPFSPPPPRKQVIPKVFHPLHSPDRPLRAFRDVGFLTDNIEFNEVSFISESVTDW